MGLVTDSKLEEELAWMRKLINTTQSIKITSTQHVMFNPSYEKAISVTTKQAIEAIIDYLGIELRVEPGKTVPEKVVASKAKKKE